MQVVYARQPFPAEWPASIFLAGPTPRSKEVPSWRPRALALLRERGFDGAVFVPEDEHGLYQADYQEQVGWEQEGLRFTDVILFWIPRDLETLPAFTTNVEFGHWVSSGKVVLGFPAGSPKNRYLGWLGEQHGVRTLPTLEATVDAAVGRLDHAASRSGGERGVPLDLWHTASFQGWYRALCAAGNRLDEARLLWSFTPGRMSAPFAWVLKVVVWVEAEQRHKSNEWVLSRSDISAVLLHGPVPSDPLDTLVVRVREFRAPVRTRDGFVHELPGGSSPHGGGSALETAAEEVHEETGLEIAPARLRPVGSRQLAATWSAHMAHLFRAELTSEELERAREMEAAGTSHGVGSERTTVQVTTARALLTDERVDWGTVGMVLTALGRD